MAIPPKTSTDKKAWCLEQAVVRVAKNSWLTGKIIKAVKILLGPICVNSDNIRYNTMCACSSTFKKNKDFILSKGSASASCRLAFVEVGVVLRSKLTLVIVSQVTIDQIVNIEQSTHKKCIWIFHYVKHWALGWYIALPFGVASKSHYFTITAEKNLTWDFPLEMWRVQELYPSIGHPKRSSTRLYPKLLVEFVNKTWFLAVCQLPAAALTYFTPRGNAGTLMGSHCVQRYHGEAPSWPILQRP